MSKAEQTAKRVARAAKQSKATPSMCAATAENLDARATAEALLGRHAQAETLRVEAACWALVAA